MVIARWRRRSLVGLGNAQSMMGKNDEAKDLFDMGADICEEQGDLQATQIISRATSTCRKRALGVCEAFVCARIDLAKEGTQSAFALTQT